jgi:hypothetical protein
VRWCCPVLWHIVLSEKQSHRLFILSAHAKSTPKQEQACSMNSQKVLCLNIYILHLRLLKPRVSVLTHLSRGHINCYSRLTVCAALALWQHSAHISQFTLPILLIVLLVFIAVAFYHCHYCYHCFCYRYCCYRRGAAAVVAGKLYTNVFRRSRCGPLQQHVDHD